MMARLVRLPLLVLMLGLAGLVMLLPAIHAVVMRDHALARAFLYTGLLVVVFAGFLGLATANRRPRNIARNHLMALAIAYLILPPVLALPLLQRPAGAAEFGAAWFEMLSSFTTTGATVFAAGSLPDTVHLWRALVGWLGGLFALVMVFSVLAPLNLGGTEVITGRLPGRASPATRQITQVADPVQRMVFYLTRILPIYGGLTLLAWLALLMAGEDSFVAFCHAMSALSTSGITPLDGAAASSAGRAAEAVMAAFLLLAISRRPILMLLGQRQEVPIWRDGEVRLAAAILGATIALIWGWHLIGAAGQGNLDRVGQALATLWGVIFTLLSFLTTAGFVAQDWHGAILWSGRLPADMALWGLAIIGGGVATTAGGVKLLRVLVLIRHGEQELDRVIHPHAVPRSAAQGGMSRAAAAQGAGMAWVVFTTFGLAIAAFTGLMTLAGQGFDQALVLSLAALTTTGPLAAHSGGVAVDFAMIEGPARAILGLAMVVGRLETLAILALLVPEHLRG